MKRRNLFLMLLGLLLCSQHAHAWSWDVTTGANNYGFTITYGNYDGSVNSSYDVNVQKFTPSYLGLGSYTKVTIPRSVTYFLTSYNVKAIDTGAFSGYTGIREVVISNGVERIGANAFQGCTGLTSVSLPSSQTDIYSRAFEGCTNLTEITLPSNLLGVQAYAFSGCSNLRTVNCTSTDPPTIGSSVFSGVSDDCVLHVPYGMEETYVARGWTTDVFKGGIVAATYIKKDGVTYSITGESTVEVVGCDETRAAAFVKESVSHYSEGQWTNFSVTGIAEGAFENHTNLKSITLPSAITSVGDRAFAGCTGLTAINVGMTTAPSVTASVFEGIVKANCKLYVPQGATSAYSSWAPYFATVVDGETFTETINGVETTFLITGETTVQLGDGAVAIPTTTSGNYAIPETVEHEGVTYTVTAIGKNAFYGCTGLTGEMVIPSSVTSLGQGVFFGCTGITSAEIPEGISVLPPYIFNNCTSLASLSLPEGLLIIYGHALYNTTALTELTIPSTVSSIQGQFALAGAPTTIVAKMLNPCQMSTSIFRFKTDCQCKLIVPQGTRDAYLNNGWTETVFTGGVVEDGQLWGYTEEGVKFLATVIDEENNGVQVFNGVLYNNTWEPEGSAIDVSTTGSVTLPSSFEYLGQTYYVKEIGECAFSGCAGITSLTIPEGVRKVGKHACWECTALESVSLPSSLDEIGGSAFYKCNLSSVTFPKYLHKLGEYAFYVNKNLTTITLPPVLTDIGNGVFMSTNLLSVIATSTNPQPLSGSSAFWPDIHKSNPVILTVPYGTRQLYLDAGYTETQGSTNGEFYKVVEQAVEKNHAFLQVGEGATVLISHKTNGLEGNQQLVPNYVYQAYLDKSETNYAYIYYKVEEGYSLKILRNGVDVTEFMEPRDGFEIGGESFYRAAMGREEQGLDGTTWSMSDNVTWQIVVTPEDSGSSSSDVNVGDVNQDGTISIADVTTLVNVVLGKAVIPGPISNVTLDYDVTLAPDQDYTRQFFPVSDRLVEAFRLTPAQIASKLLDSPADPQNGEIELVSYDAEGQVTDCNLNRGEIGYWYDADGHPMNWGYAKLAVYFDKEAKMFALLLRPDTTSGTSVTVNQQLIYKDEQGKTATATLNFHITVADGADFSATLR